jgi:hypothetical protein
MTTPPRPSVRVPALAALLERARSLEAEPEDIDALLAAMDRPVAPGESVRARAEVLQRIIHDPVLGGLRGADQRRVDATAAHALVALGEPYAGELSAAGRELLGDARSHARAQPAIGKDANVDVAPPPLQVKSPRSPVIGALAVLWGLAEMLFLIVDKRGRLSGVDFVWLFFLSLNASFTLVVPGLKLIKGSLGPVARNVYGALNLLLLLLMGTGGLLLSRFIHTTHWMDSPVGRTVVMMLASVLARTVVLGGLLAAKSPPEAAQASGQPA